MQAYPLTRLGTLASRQIGNLFQSEMLKNSALDAGLTHLIAMTETGQWRTVGQDHHTHI